MKFSEVVLEKVGYIFKKYGLLIIEQRDYYLKVQSNVLTIVIVHDVRENAYMLFLANCAATDSIEIDNETMKFFFNSDLKMSQLPVEAFVTNLTLFFGNEAKDLLEGNITRNEELQRFNLVRSKKYTEEILARQFFTAVDTAWSNNDYVKFISLIEHADNDKLSDTYKLKYKIAVKKLQQN